ncbi:MAG TPA: hypothetical protein VFC50_03760 [Candidatus Dormibacteraeota bacterium]|nr:hypothetical protein [Candidatus Dormibacteraeota bacterium]
MNTLPPPGQRFVRSWEPLALPGGELSVGDYERLDGSRHLYFSGPGLPDHQPPPSDADVTRIVYRKLAGEAVLLGVSVESRLKGAGLGKTLVDHFMEHVEDETGLPCFRTGRVNKPVMALTLQRAGFQPTNMNVLAAILPRSELSDPDIPRVQIVRNRLGVGRLVTRSPRRHWTFYKIVSDEEAREETLGVHSPLLVALHTRYVKRPDQQD